MSDLTNDIRLAVDSGKTAIGMKTVVTSIKKNEAKLIVIADKNRQSNTEDIMHMATVAGIKVRTFKGNPVELGAVCGKPFSVSAISVIEPGDSNILKEDE